jgi:predicted DNA repair protein MutK
LASGIFALLDDIALLADDVAVTTKVATTKTAGILGDDLAVNAEKAVGFAQERELKVIWAITKGSFINKLIILPVAFLLSGFAPWLIPIILVIGGLYLLYEGSEKVEEYFHKHTSKSHHEEELLHSTTENILDIEQKKIKAAIVTDFILSIEIVILALGTVLDKPLPIQIATTTLVAIIATVGVYGLVALIVRLDNIGLWLIEKNQVKSGNFLIALMPKIIKSLGFIGTFAMILVGGGILTHNIEFIHHLAIPSLPALLNEFLVGIVIGFMVLIIVNGFKKILKNNDKE